MQLMHFEIFSVQYPNCMSVDKNIAEAHELIKKQMFIGTSKSAYW